MAMVLNQVLVKTCSYCNGAGHVSVEQNTILGRVRTQQTCPKCDGTGFEEPCPTCHGKGIENKTVKLEVTVPEGVDNDQQLDLWRRNTRRKRRTTWRLVCRI